MNEHPHLLEAARLPMLVDKECSTWDSRSLLYENAHLQAEIVSLRQQLAQAEATTQYLLVHLSGVTTQRKVECEDAKRCTVQAQSRGVEKLETDSSHDLKQGTERSVHPQCHEQKSRASKNEVEDLLSFAENPDDKLYHSTESFSASSVKHRDGQLDAFVTGRQHPDPTQRSADAFSDVNGSLPRDPCKDLSGTLRVHEASVWQTAEEVVDSTCGGIGTDVDYETRQPTLTVNANVSSPWASRTYRGLESGRGFTIRQSDGSSVFVPPLSTRRDSGIFTKKAASTQANDQDLDRFSKQAANILGRSEHAGSAMPSFDGLPHVVSSSSSIDPAVQALFAHRALDDLYPFRTILITEIPVEATLAQVLGSIRGGTIVSATYLDTVGMKLRAGRSMSSNTVMIIFVDGRRLSQFIAYCKGKLTIPAGKSGPDGKTNQVELPITLIESKTHNRGFAIGRAIEAGLTRILFVHDTTGRLTPGDVLDRIRNLNPWPSFYFGGQPIAMAQDDNGTMFFEFASMVEAEAAWLTIDRNPVRFLDAQKGFQSDYCNGPFVKRDGGTLEQLSQHAGVSEERMDSKTSPGERGIKRTGCADRVAQPGPCNGSVLVQESTYNREASEKLRAEIDGDTPCDNE